MKKILSTIFATALLITNIQGVTASEGQSKMEKSVLSVSMSSEHGGLNSEQEKALKTYTELFVDSGMYQDFQLSDKGEMVSIKSFAQLQEEYGLNEDEMAFIQKVIATNNQAVQSPIDIPGAPNPRIRMSVKNFRVYLTYNETKSYLGSAVIAGPIAVVGALAAIGGMAGGPLGTVVCGLAGAYGASHIVDVTKSAINKRKGIWLGWGGIGIN